MAPIKSLDELKRLKEETLNKRKMAEASGYAQITVAMGTCGIAAGARQTMKAILDFIENESISDVVVRQTGNSGLDEWEPIIQVAVGEQPQVTYGKVTPEVAQRIMQEHVLGEKIVTEYVVTQ